MSRSYRKFLSLESDEFEPPEWPSIRQAELQCCRQEMYAFENGDVLFPRYSRTREGCWASGWREYYPKRDICDRYFTEIRNILNGYQKWWSLRDRERHSEAPREDCRKTFIESFERIKRGEILDGVRMDRYERPLEWLHTHEAKEAVKEWEGDPLDILYHLTCSGIIEKAVRDRCKRMLKK